MKNASEERKFHKAPKEIFDKGVHPSRLTMFQYYAKSWMNTVGVSFATNLRYIASVKPELKLLPEAKAEDNENLVNIDDTYYYTHGELANSGYSIVMKKQEAKKVLKRRGQDKNSATWMEAYSIPKVDTVDPLAIAGCLMFQFACMVLFAHTFVLETPVDLSDTAILSYYLPIFIVYSIVKVAFDFYFARMMIKRLAKSTIHQLLSEAGIIISDKKPTESKKNAKKKKKEKKKTK
eukprot:CAMPEP_0167758220 /NCGR_PEP_ID=MMETSP0110_2-20121227/10350_1 /TAXON_ID=629695 /ORGANISM="Gymnochlora sp., Strain CCMP2014" /LENGTH=234 /DNA_ID=CAMNT_0007644477 /DNA_START=105 /DNA_END=809 /DNA_ORIENTATION=+